MHLADGRDHVDLTSAKWDMWHVDVGNGGIGYKGCLSIVDLFNLR